MAAHQFFGDVSAATAAEIDRSARTRSVAAGYSLFHQGDAPDEVFGIVAGRVKVSRATPTGAAMTLMILGRGELVGAVSSARRVSRTITATAQTDLDLLVWSSGVLTRLMRADPAMSEHFMRLLSGWTMYFVDRLEEMFAPVEQRVARTLVRLVEEQAADPAGVIRLPIARDELAEITCTTMPTLSRIMSRWRAAGVIDGRRRGLVTIPRLQSLVEIGRPPH